MASTCPRCAALLLAVLTPFALASAPPPVAKVVPVTDDYYGTTVTDPYRWMERGDDPDWLPWLKRIILVFAHQLDNCRKKH